MILFNYNIVYESISCKNILWKQTKWRESRVFWHIMWVYSVFLNKNTKYNIINTVQNINSNIFFQYLQIQFICYVTRNPHLFGTIFPIIDSACRLLHIVVFFRVQILIFIWITFVKSVRTVMDKDWNNRKF